MFDNFLTNSYTHVIDYLEYRLGKGDIGIRLVIISMQSSHDFHDLAFHCPRIRNIDRLHDFVEFRDIVIPQHLLISLIKIRAKGACNSRAIPFRDTNRF